MTKWRAIRKIVLPAARPGIATGLVLGMGLVAGYTAIVWLTLGGTMTMALTTGGIRPTGDGPQGHRVHAHDVHLLQLACGRGQRAALAFGAALLLVGLLLVLNLVAAFIGRRSQLDVRT